MLKLTPDEKDYVTFIVLSKTIGGIIFSSSAIVKGILAEVAEADMSLL